MTHILAYTYIKHVYIHTSGYGYRPHPRVHRGRNCYTHNIVVPPVVGVVVVVVVGAAVVVRVLVRLALAPR